MFKPVPANVDFVEQEHAILRLWEDTRAFARLRQLRQDGPRWSFIDGPITANNPMGVHHGWGRTYKDLFHRFEAMRGKHTRYQNGFDCQGLWVEVNVERDLGFTSKRDIENLGIDKFILLCKQKVLRFAAVQTRQSIRLGYWMDWNRPEDLERLRDALGEDPLQAVTLDGPSGPVEDTAEAIVGRLGSAELGGSYFTFSDENNYTIWHLLKECHQRGWIYKGHDVMPWCGRCGTGLSQHEIVTEGYQEIVHPSVTLRFPLRGRPGESLLVWTTTPWTLTSNVAAAVGPDLEYVQARQGDETFYLSRGTLGMLRGPYEVVGSLRGKDLEGWSYAGPFDHLPAARDRGAPEAHRVILWDEVGEVEGTGIVHIAPGCGAEDFALSKRDGLPVVAPLDEGALFLPGFDWLTGQHAEEARSSILEDLKARGLAYAIDDYSHRYPVCWRCSSELVFRLVDEWFIAMGAPLEKPWDEVTSDEMDSNLRLQLMDVVQRETGWHPDFGKERELDWLRNMHDWMISKKRYWGLALPIYECPACQQIDVIGSREELQRRAVEGWESFDGHSPHRPYVDAVKIACSRCGGTVSRIPDVGNPWLDAGIVAMSTLRYRHDRDYWATWFPADMISESFPGQFRNWFYSLITMSTILERKAPFRDVFTYATLLAEDGRAMHKSAGNMVEFNEAADRMGVDVMRWLYTSQRPEKDLLFGYHHADETRRQFLLPLWNIYNFFVTYALIDGWTPAQSPPDGEPPLLDRWILARLVELCDEMTARMDSFEPHLATSAAQQFLDELSNWYLRRSRRRFWSRTGASAASDADKGYAYATLYTVLTTFVRLLAPFVPFVTEAMYQNLVRSFDEKAPASVHHLAWPEGDAAARNPGLVGEMALVLRLASLGHAARSQAGRKVRQPLSEAAFAVRNAAEGETLRRHAALLAEELNVKSVRVLDTATEAVDYRLKPLPRQLGQKYGARFPPIRAALLALDPEMAARRLASGEALEVVVGGETLAILPDEVEVHAEAHAGFSAAVDGPYVAALATDLTPALEREGLAREAVRRIQEWRRQAGLQIAQRIEVEYHASPRLAEAIEAHRAYLASEVLADRLERQDLADDSLTASFDFEGEHLRLRVSPRPEPVG
ncbi:MAG TPA: class I tRNA ligase family protein [Anaerolineales bacterium]|nr:class I tRNA ligase family protein [Anaerolineales bacterium]